MVPLPALLLTAKLPEAWQPVPREDLALKDNPVNPVSAAMILERQIYTDDERRIETEWVRIKIFTEEGRAYASTKFIGLIADITEDDRARMPGKSVDGLGFGGSLLSE
jgi:PAS domain-containing protein